MLKMINVSQNDYWLTYPGYICAWWAFFFSRTRTPPQPRKSSRKSNKKQRLREAQSATSRRMTRAAMDSAHKENEIMLRRLARKRRGQPRLSESDKNLTLARLAGLDIPAGGFGVSDKNKTDSKTSRRRNRSPKSGEKSRGMSTLLPILFWSCAVIYMK